MDLHNLIVMANRIGDFFAAQPDRDEALAGNRLSGTVSTKGTYRVTVTAHDTHGATGSAVITLVVA